ncbi:MAG: 50S ribosomal protein L7/L12 [Candidatus Eremiobacteraeota bacterium]|nr:50S ribosomal protein L7/L12 [Candidatus Eremiobacteraeota bacterium]
MDKKELVEVISGLTLMEAADLVKELEEKLGIKASAPMAMMAAMPAAGAAAEVKEEKTAFDLELTEVGSNKIQVIKVVREVTSLGLKEAKDLVEGAPKVVKDGITKEEAEKIKAKFEEVGAKVVIK